MRLRSGSVGFFTDHYPLLLYYSFLPQRSMKLTTSCLTLDAFQLIKSCLLHKTIKLLHRGSSSLWNVSWGFRSYKKVENHWYTLLTRSVPCELHMSSGGYWVRRMRQSPQAPPFFGAPPSILRAPPRKQHIQFWIRSVDDSE